MMGYGETRLWTVMIKLTAQCTAKCAHCSVRSGPDRTEHLSWKHIQHVVATCPEIGIDTIWISGGEPFLRLRYLRRILAMAKGLSLRVIINSNAYWALSLKSSRHTLATLLECGPFEIVFSSDDFHLPYISFERVENAASAATSLGIKCWLGRVTYVGDQSRADMLARASRIGLSVTEQPLQMIGRANQELVNIQTTDVRRRFSPCSTVIIPTIMTDGRVSICCTGAASENPRLIIGDLRHQSFKEIVTIMQTDLVQNALRAGGPGFLFDLISPDGEELDIRYQSKCQFCRMVCQLPDLDERLQRAPISSLLARLVSIDLLQRTRQSTSL